MYSFKLSDDEEELLQKINNLKLMGWDNSLAYHFSTLDYPFIDYSTMEGHYLDQQRMQKYYLKEKEISRYKEYLNTSEVKGNAPYIASFRDINLTQKTLLEILSFVLGKLYEVESIKVQTPVLKKTVPSGGSRHPTEAYLAISDVNGIEPGVYHYNCNDYTLNHLNIPYKGEKLENLFFSYEGYIGFEPRVSIILTSVFERNMFRYREPRTFRSIYIDVGHVLSAITHIATRLNFACKYQYNFNQKAIEKFLQISPFEEGIIVVLHLQ